MIALISQSTLASEEQPFSSVDLQHEEPYIQQLKIWQQQVQDSTDYDYLIPLKDQKGTISESTDRQGVHLINEDQSFTFRDGIISTYF